MPLPTDSASPRSRGSDPASPCHRRPIRQLHAVATSIRHLHAAAAQIQQLHGRPDSESPLSPPHRCSDHSPHLRDLAPNPSSIDYIGKGLVRDDMGFITFSVKYQCVIFRPHKDETLEAVVTMVIKMGFFVEAWPVQIFVSNHRFYKIIASGAKVSYETHSILLENLLAAGKWRKYIEVLQWMEDAEIRPPYVSECSLICMEQ